MKHLSAFSAFTLLVLVGCGPAGHTVKGTVSFDGAPVPDGTIVFQPKDTTIAPDSGPIKDGKYSLIVKPGQHNVEIRASKLMPLPAGTKGAMGETELHQEYIPEKYNAKTELSADISGAKEQNFDLKSK
jgi:hypothetical protein